MITTEPSQQSASPPTVAPLSAKAQSARRRALIAIAAVGGLLVLLWFSDSLAGLLPSKPYQPTTQTAGAYRITLSISPTQPHAGAPIHAQIALTDTARHAIPGATVTYTWEMIAMDMGTASGHADQATTTGRYAATFTPLMGGAWRLTIHIHTPQLPDGSTAFTVQAHS